MSNVMLICSCVLFSYTLCKVFNVDPADYMIYICGDDTFREHSSLGQSGKFYYLGNGQYVIKIMKKPEVEISSLFHKRRGIPALFMCFIYNSVSMTLPTKNTGVWTQNIYQRIVNPLN